MDYATLSLCSIFRDMSEKEIYDSCRFLSAHEKHYKKGDFIFKITDDISEFAVLTSGLVQISNVDLDGNSTITDIIFPGDSFCESLSLIGGLEAPVFAVAKENSCVVWFNPSYISSSYTENRFINKLNSNMIKTLADKCLRSNERIQILSKKTIKEKVMLYLHHYCEKFEKNSVSIPFSRQDFANYLGVERSALSRELSNMQKSGLIKIEKDTIYLS